MDGKFVNISRLTIAGRPFAEYVESVYRTTVKYGSKQDEYSIKPSKTYLEVYGYYDNAYSKFLISFEPATFTVLKSQESDAMDLTDLGLQFMLNWTDNVFPTEYVPEFYKLGSDALSFGFADIETGEKFFGKIPTRMLEISGIRDRNEYFVMLMDDESNISFYATDEQLCQKNGFQRIEKLFDYNQHTETKYNGRIEIPISSGSGIYRIASINKPIVYTYGICEPTPVGGLAEIKVNYETMDVLNELSKILEQPDRYYFSHWTITEEVEIVEGDIYSERIVIRMPDVVSLEIGMERKTSATVTFDANEGSGTMTPVPITQTNEYTLPANSFTAPEAA